MPLMKPAFLQLPFQQLQPAALHLTLIQCLFAAASMVSSLHNSLIISSLLELRIFLRTSFSMSTSLKLMAAALTFLTSNGCLPGSTLATFHPQMSASVVVSGCLLSFPSSRMGDVSSLSVSQTPKTKLLRRQIARL